MQTTTNYGYNVPESGDAADITKVAQNFVDIDSDLKNVSDGVTTCCTDLSEKLDQISTKVDTVSNTTSDIKTNVENLPTTLETDFTEVKNAIAGVKTDVGNVNTAVGNVNTAVSNVESDVNAVNTVLSNVKNDTSNIKNSIDNSTLLKADSIVKSVQRGFANKTVSYSENASATISISPVNSEKSILLCEVNFISGGSTKIILSKTLESQSIKISLKINTSSEISIDWQVIEFY